MKTTKEKTCFRQKIMQFAVICWLIIFAAATTFAQFDFTIDDGKNKSDSSNRATAGLNGGGTIHTVSGNVKATGANLPDAMVVLIYYSSIVESVMTDANGNYSLSAIEGVSYTVSVYKNGYNFNPSYQILNDVQAAQTVNFQSGTLLCVPAPAGLKGENYCQNATVTAASQIQNGKIAFEMFGNAFAVNADGTNQMQLPPAGSFPSWSPDGTRLLYNRTTSFDPDHEIYISNADGTGFRQITVNFVNDYKAQWSPDGTRAVFYRLFDSSNIEIFTINTDSPNNGINEVRLTNDDCVNRDPSYSPNGEKIVFIKNCESSSVSGIYTMNAVDGSDPFQLTSGGLDGSPAWRPDGDRIVFVRNGELWLVNTSGSAVIQLTYNSPFLNFSPVYSPDGAKIAFSRAPTETEYQEIYTLNPQSNQQIRVTNIQQLPFNKEYPSWQRVIGSVGVSLVGGAVNLNFSNVTNGGNSVATPIAPASAGTLPSGYFLIPQSVAYDVRSSAQFSDAIEICFNISEVNDETDFNRLTVFHNEDGLLVDRTSSRDFPARKICATVTSLSPFVVAATAAPTAASVSVSGRVQTPTGRGLINATILMTDSAGNTRSTRTNMFGDYLFEEVEAGQTYVFSVRSKRHQFAGQVVTVTEDLTELNFTPED